MAKHQILLRLARLTLKSLITPQRFRLLPWRLQNRIITLALVNNWDLKLTTECKRIALRRPSAAQRSEPAVPQIVGYLPYGTEGWILQFLFEDLSRFARSTDFILAHTIAELQLRYYASDRAIVLSMHPSFLPSLLSSGVPANDLYAFYTHSRVSLGMCGMDAIGGLFPMNSCEAATLSLSSINPSRIRVFPAGYDSFLFTAGPDRPFSSRDIDVLFVGRYVGRENDHYYKRKNYELVIPLAKELARSGLKVVTLGKDWEQCGDDDFMAVVERLNLPHSQYPTVYGRSKLYVSASIQEGGPVSWLEAMACGCLTLSNPTGFALELRSGELGAYLMSQNSSVADWICNVHSILNNILTMGNVDMQLRQQFLTPASFQELAIILEEIAHDSLAFRSCLKWPSAHKRDRVFVEVAPEKGMHS